MTEILFDVIIFLERGKRMELRSVRHDKALRLAEQKILCSRLARYVKELYIYGSAARGAEKWNSDIDLLLVLDPEKKEIVKSKEKSYI